MLRCMSTAAAVVVTGVVRAFAEGSRIVTGLRCDRLTVRQGEFLAVCGPSGSGKSTLLGLIAGLDQPTDGEIVVLGRRLAEMTQASLSAWRGNEIGLVFQDPHLLPHLTALENLIIARLPWLSARDATARAMDLLQRVELEPIADQPASFLSRGQQQRVGLVRALMHSPRLLLADEPTASLDPATAGGMLAVLQRLREAAGATLVLATHDRSIASAADRQHDLSVA